MVVYKDSTLAKGSRALELYQQWKKTNKNEDKKLLDQHMKQLDTNEQELLRKYSN